METSGPPARVQAQQIVHPLAHFLRGFVGERDRHDGGAGDAMGFHQVRDAMGNDPGFSAAGAGQQQKRPFHVRDSRLLLRI